MKRGFGSARWVAALALGALLLNATAAQAYIDPGSGSMIFQIVIGALLASAVAIKAFWRRIVALFSRRSKDAEPLP